MKTITKTFLFAAALAAAFAVNPARAGVEVGQPAPNFSLTDLDGKTHTLSDYKGKIVVLEWVNPECPIVVNHYKAKNMQATQKAATADGVVWFSINSASYPGAQGDYDEAKAKEWQSKVGAASSAYLRDRTGKVGRQYGATNTPHMYVINKDGTLAYQGAIDSGNSKDIPTATNYVKAALESLKAGKPIEKSATKAYGCGIKYGKDT
jgi:peroxiredoxin